MDEKKRFQKKNLNKDDHKGMKNAAKAVKGGAAGLGALALIVFNKENLKTLGKGALNIATKVLKK